MKLSAILSLVGLMTVATAAAIVPKVDYTPRCVKVDGIERQDTCTRVSVTLQNYPKYWVNIPHTVFLHAVGDTTVRYHVKGEENIPLDKKIKMPASGEQSGTLIFERVPDDVSVVDLVIDDICSPTGNVLGIHLDEEDTTVYPDFLTAADLFGSKEHATETWTGLNPERYKDMSFYNKDGKMHFCGRLVDYTPRAGITTFTLSTHNDLTDTESITTGDINADGTFAVDVPVAYPQFAYLSMGSIKKDLCLIPGDTLSLVASMKVGLTPSKEFAPVCYGFEGDLDDGIAVNILTDTVISHFDLNDLYRRYKVEVSDSMLTQIYVANRQLCAKLDTVMTGLPALLGTLPISDFAKDILSCKAAGELLMQIEHYDMDLRHAENVNNVSGNQSKKLDLITYIAPREKYNGIVYDNPLMLCYGFILPNRWKFSSVFHSSNYAARGLTEGSRPGAFISVTNGDTGPLERDIARLDSLGIGNCFVAQLVREVGLASHIKTSKPEHAHYNTPRFNSLMPLLLKHTDYKAMDEALMETYADYITRVAIAENQLSGTDGVNIDTSAYDGLLERIIAPYKGNVLYLDFWGLGCGSCRAGMIRQKPLLEKYADRPFRALYIANSEDNMEGCKKWLEKENIKGEHIFLSGDDWRRMQSLFNFSGIPFGVIINKNGKILEKGHIHLHDNLIKDALNNNL